MTHWISVIYPINIEKALLNLMCAVGDRRDYRIGESFEKILFGLVAFKGFCSVDEWTSMYEDWNSNETKIGIWENYVHL